MRERVAHLSERVYALAVQLEDLQHLLDGLRKATDRCSMLARQVDPYAMSDPTSTETPRASSDGLDSSRLRRTSVCHIW
ncbi:hypothetical protein M3A96_10955 [Helcobacillus massiliensis]|uniref:hypothetical protein n=1 Tax=Helcobacillus massiliensis TaxID=521392 RepID=UPI0021A511B2|nr:hypothetical protein [Helcobacillus massiliensis]MCT1558627.1 hypothetical protein [Helcobacillus massiliensis]MCT2037087.1 hypothetical protein [Helcobacillus massiliensis]MCT2330830.1 hypothetical protein [Helcobacillus massiliensis]